MWPTTTSSPDQGSWPASPSLILGLCLALLEFPGLTLAAGPADLKLRLDLADHAGPIPPGQRFTLSVRVDGAVAQTSESLVVIVTGPNVPTRLAPFLLEEGTNAWRTELDLEAPEFVGVGSSSGYVALTCAVARRGAAQLTTLIERTVYITVGNTPEPVGQAGSALSEDTATALMASPEATQTGDQPPPPLAPAVVSDTIQEAPLLPAAGPTPSYWKSLQGKILQRVRGHATTEARTNQQQAATLHFRLYPNGTTQLLHLDPGSGNAEVDHALLLAVVEAQPFAPFPSEVAESHLDVHFALPSASRPSRATPSR